MPSPPSSATARPQDRLSLALRKDQGKLLGFARSRLPATIRDQDAEDVLSDVVLKLLERADILADVENITAYLFTAIGNRIADLFRRRREEEIPESLPEAAAPASQEDRTQLTEALALLSTAERAVWLAVEMDGRSFSELAELWNEPIGTLLSRKSRATKALRKHLDGGEQRPALPLA